MCPVEDFFVDSDLISSSVMDKSRCEKCSGYIWYCVDRVAFCNIYVIQQDTQYLMINFINNIQ